MKVLNFGSCNVDYVYSMSHIVREGETIPAQNLELFAGGKGLNQSIAAARAGVSTYHAGCIGYDGQMLRDILTQSGVDLSYLREVDEKNGHAIIQVDEQGNNCIVIYAGSNHCVTRGQIDGVLEQFSSNDIILLQNEINDVEYVIEKAHEKGMCVVFNPSPIDAVISRIDFDKISYVILNEIEAEGITGRADTDGQLDFFCKNYPDLKVILTLGKNGAIMMYDGRLLREAALDVCVVDTTAAGDTFTGYFVAGLAAGDDYGLILRRASVAAAIAVSRAGAAPSIPTEAEVLDAMDELRPIK